MNGGKMLISLERISMVDRSDLFRIVAIFSLAVAISAGHASIPKLSAFTLPAMAQFRFAFAVIAAAYALMVIRDKRNPAALKLAMLLAGLCLFLALHAAIFGVGQFSRDYIVDLVYLATFGFVCAALIRSEKDIDAFCVALIVVAIPMVPMWYFKDPQTFTAFTTITYYRIEFFAYVACTYFAIRGARLAWIGAALFLFFTLDSTSKSAVIFAPISVAYLCFGLALRGPILSKENIGRSALVHLVLLAIVATAFIQLRSDTVASRIEYVAIGKSSSVADLNMGSSVADLNMDGVAKNNLFTFNDGTQRVRMAIRAIDLAKQKILTGAGIGAYSISLLNSGQDGFDVYRYPHNVTLELLYSTGLIGIAFYGLCLFVFLIYLHRQMIEHQDTIAIGCGAFFALITSHFAGDFYDMRMFWLLIIIVVGARAAPGDDGASFLRLR